MPKERDLAGLKGRALTPREREVLQLMANGKDSPTMAMILGVAKRTVEAHANHLRAKLGADNRPHAVAQGFRQGIII